jgi:hypothetical protein
MSKYRVTVVYSILQTIEVEAECKDDAEEIAFYLFDQSQAFLGEGEIYETVEVTE